ncbi:MAG: hypothetical protein JWM09_944 [Francisellaceae bacterium]|nr:hypothetical protein [Francisellaceae bacterium]
MEEILKRDSIPNPHVMFMAVGEVNCDKSPLQVTQFEADIRIAEQLKNLYLEGGGGGNDSESYPLAWYFAAAKTALDCYKNRGEKEILFTIGDDNAPAELKGVHLKKFLNIPEARDISTKNILDKVQTYYEVFHLGIKESFTYTTQVKQGWQALLGERLIEVADYTKIPELIVSTIDCLRGNKAKPINANLATSLENLREVEVGMAPSSSSASIPMAHMGYQWIDMPMEQSPPPYEAISPRLSPGGNK